jgi:hypothetical protein
MQGGGGGGGGGGSTEPTLGWTKGDHREFLKNSKSAPNHFKLSQNFLKTFLSSKQSLSSDKNIFLKILIK